MLTKGDDLTINIDFSHTISEPQCRLEAVGKSSCNSGLAHKSIDHNLDRVILVTSELLIRLQKFCNLYTFAIYSRTSKTL